MLARVARCESMRGRRHTAGAGEALRRTSCRSPPPGALSSAPMLGSLNARGGARAVSSPSLADSGARSVALPARAARSGHIPLCRHLTPPSACHSCWRGGPRRRSPAPRALSRTGTGATGSAPRGRRVAPRAAYAAARPPEASCQGVRIRGPAAVIATVNSKWAARDPSSE